MNTETGSRNLGKNGFFCLKHAQELKDSAAHPHPNFPQVRPYPRPRIKTCFFFIFLFLLFFLQYPGASFASPGILDFRLIVTSYVSRCVSWHPIKSITKAVAAVYIFWRWVGEILPSDSGKGADFKLFRAGYLVTWSAKKVFKLN